MKLFKNLIFVTLALSARCWAGPESLQQVEAMEQLFAQRAQLIEQIDAIGRSKTGFQVPLIGSQRQGGFIIESLTRQLIELDAQIVRALCDQAVVIDALLEKRLAALLLQIEEFLKSKIADVEDTHELSPLATLINRVEECNWTDSETTVTLINEITLRHLQITRSLTGRPGSSAVSPIVFGALTESIREEQGSAAQCTKPTQTEGPQQQTALLTEDEQEEEQKQEADECDWVFDISELGGTAKPIQVPSSMPMPVVVVQINQTVPSSPIQFSCRNCVGNWSDL